jgi:hypothetical protein
MLDLIAEFLLDAIGDLFDSGAEAAAEAAAGAATDVGVDAALGAGIDVVDPGAIAPAVDAAGGGGTPFVFDNHPISATLRSAGFSGPV